MSYPTKLMIAPPRPASLSRRFNRPGMIPALLLAMLAAPLIARDGVRVSGDGNRVELDTARWDGARPVSPRQPGQADPGGPILRLMTGGPGARLSGPDLGCVTASHEGRHRGRPFLHITLDRTCLDGRTLRLRLEGAPLWRRGKSAEIDDLEKQWLSVSFANYDPDFDPGPAAAAAAPGPAAPAFTGPRLRIEISAAIGAGVYRVTKNQMITQAGFPASFNPADLKLTRGGVEIPILVSGDFTSLTHTIEFHGAPLTGENRPGEWENGDYTDTESYFLTLESGARLRLSPLSGTPVNGYPVASNFMETARRELNNKFVGHVDAAGETHFFDPTLIFLADAEVTKTVNFTFTVPNPAPAAAQPANIIVRVRERGFYNPPTAVHNVAFRLNGANPSPLPTSASAQPPVPVVGGAFQWPNNATLPFAPFEKFTLTFPPAALLGGTNTLAFVLTAASPPLVYEEQLLDWIELDYNRLFIAAGNKLAFALPDQNSRVQISGLTGGTTAADLLLYEITAPDSPRPVTGFTVGGTTLTVEIAQNAVPGAARRFLLVSVTSATLLPAALTSAPDPGLLTPLVSPKFLVIYHPDLIAGAAATSWNQFIARKVAQFGGVASNVRAIPVQDVYNEFSYGRFAPEALHSLIQQALATWPAPLPQYVLLVGDGTADTKDNLGRALQGCPSCVEPGYKNWVPTRSVDDPLDTFTGFWATDAGLADADNSGLPELAVGRLSVRTPAELNAVLNKHASYDGAATYQPWMGRSLCTTDKIDGGFDAFHQLCDDYASNMPAPQATTKLYYGMAPYNGSDSNDASTPFALALRACMNGGINTCPGNAGTGNTTGGYGLINYIGHGDQYEWSGHSFFSEIVNSRNNTVTNSCHPSPSTSTTDIDLLCQQPPPQTAYLLVFNCLSGAFSEPRPAPTAVYGTDTLAELAYKKAVGGPVGGIAPTSVGYTSNDDLQLRAFRAALNGELKIRDWGVLTQAIRAAPTSSYTANFSTIFFGDPAQSLKIPVPAPPTGLTATAGNAQVSLNFTASADAAARYVRIYRALQPPGAPGPDPYAFLTCLPVAQTSYIDTGLINTSTYFYRLASVDNNPTGCNGFEGAWGAAANATPMNPNPPATPTGMVATDPGVGVSLDFSFTGVADSDLLRYTVYWGTAPNAPTASMNNGTQTIGSISGLTPNVRYYISASATNTSLRESARSAEASAIPRQTYGGIRPAAAVTGLTLIKSGAADIRLNWIPVTTDIFGDPTTLTGQRVYRADVRGPGGYNFNVFSPWPRPTYLDATAVPPLTVSSITWLDVGARSGGVTALSLGYLVLESNGQGDGAASAALPAGILDWTLRKSTITSGRISGSFSLITADVSGVPLPSAPLYRLYRRTVPAVYDRSAAHANSSVVTTGAFCEGTAYYCKDSDLGDGNNYFYAILVEDGHGSSSPY